MKGIEDKSLQRYLNATWISESNKDMEASTYRQQQYHEMKSDTPPKGGADEDPQIAKIN